jgi:hypothetical protein
MPSNRNYSLPAFAHRVVFIGARSDLCVPWQTYLARRRIANVFSLTFSLPHKGECLKSQELLNTLSDISPQPHSLEEKEGCGWETLKKYALPVIHN